MVRNRRHGFHIHRRLQLRVRDTAPNNDSVRFDKERGILLLKCPQHCQVGQHRNSSNQFHEPFPLPQDHLVPEVSLIHPLVHQGCVSGTSQSSQYPVCANSDQRSALPTQRFLL